MEMEWQRTRFLPAAKSVRKSDLLCKLFDMFRLVFNFESCPYKVDFFTDHWSGLHGTYEFDDAACWQGCLRIVMHHKGNASTWLHNLEFMQRERADSVFLADLFSHVLMILVQTTTPGRTCWVTKSFTSWLCGLVRRWNCTRGILED